MRTSPQTLSLAFTHSQIEKPKSSLASHRHVIMDLIHWKKSLCGNISTLAVTLILLSSFDFKRAVQAGLVNEDGPSAYGVDISFPIHHASVSTNFPWLENNHNGSQPLQVLGDKQSFYEDFLRSCRQKDGLSCDEAENFRIETNLNQPPSMVVRTYFRVIFNAIQT